MWSLKNSPRRPNLNKNHFQGAISYLLEKLPSIFCIPIESLILFLKFKENFVDAEQRINPELLSQELTQYSKIDFSYKVIATWLLGCYAGYQRISPIIYAANSEKIKFYKGDTLSIDKIDKHELVVDLETIVEKDITQEKTAKKKTAKKRQSKPKKIR